MPILISRPRRPVCSFLAQKRALRQHGGDRPGALWEAMPELPEVETVRRGLQPALEGARLVRVQARRPDLRFALPEHFEDRLTGARIGALGRRAKYLLAPLDTGETLVMHLGMTGRFEIEDGLEDRPGRFHYAAPVGGKHAHVVFETEAGRRVVYSDARRFGFMGLIRTDGLERHAWFAGMGPEPLGEKFNADHLQTAFAGRIQAIKTLLLDQRIVAGLGNIYVCEALHRAGISPFKAAGEIARPRLTALARAVREVLAEAIMAGGSTLRDYVGADGALGYFQHQFRAYGRQEQPCLKPGCRGIIARRIQGGRSSFYCPVCQT
jgi:formamidopyrimidine-DNA glycosylase